MESQIEFIKILSVQVFIDLAINVLMVVNFQRICQREIKSRKQKILYQTEETATNWHGIKWISRVDLQSRQVDILSWTLITYLYQLFKYNCASRDFTRILVPRIFILFYTSVLTEGINWQIDKWVMECYNFILSEEVILNEDRTTDEDKLRIMEGNPVVWIKRIVLKCKMESIAKKFGKSMQF